MASHAAADLSSPELRDWTPGQESADSALLSERGTIVARAADLIRNNGVAAGSMQTIADNVIGANGLRLSSRPMYKLLGQDKDWAREWGNTVEDFHDLWWGDTACDACDELDGAGLTHQIARTLWLHGEACAIPMWLPDPQQLFATKLLLIDPARLSNPDGKKDTDTLRAGVQRNAWGRADGYWVRGKHPAESSPFGGFGGAGRAAGDTWQYIPARTTWGRRRFIHVHDKDRVGQTRGKPVLAAVMEQFQMLGHYQRTELKAAIVNALIAAFITTPLDQDSIVELFGGNAEAARQYLDDTQATSKIKLRGGSIIPLNPGEQVSAFTPARPATGFDSFVMASYRHIAAGLNIPYELLLKDFTRTNYSSARAALLEAWRYFNGLRRKIATQFCQPAYLLVLEEMVDLGIVEAPDYHKMQRAYSASRWIGAGRGWVDPVKEAQAAQIRMDSGLSTLEAEAAEQGLDWEEVLEQRALEIERMQELGLAGAYAASATRPVISTPQDPQDPQATESSGSSGSAGSSSGGQQSQGADAGAQDAAPANQEDPAHA